MPIPPFWSFARGVAVQAGQELQLAGFCAKIGPMRRIYLSWERRDLLRLPLAVCQPHARFVVSRIVLVRRWERVRVPHSSPVLEGVSPAAVLALGMVGGKTRMDFATTTCLEASVVASLHTGSGKDLGYLNMVVFENRIPW